MPRLHQLTIDQLNHELTLYSQALLRLKQAYSTQELASAKLKYQTISQVHTDLSQRFRLTLGDYQSDIERVNKEFHDMMQTMAVNKIV